MSKTTTPKIRWEVVKINGYGFNPKVMAYCTIEVIARRVQAALTLEASITMADEVREHGIALSAPRGHPVYEVRRHNPKPKR